MMNRPWFWILMGIGAVDQYWMMAHHIGRGENWLADAIVGTMCLFSMVIGLIGWQREKAKQSADRIDE